MVRTGKQPLIDETDYDSDGEAVLIEEQVLTAKHVAAKRELERRPLEIQNAAPQHGNIQTSAMESATVPSFNRSQNATDGIACTDHNGQWGVYEWSQFPAWTQK